MKTVIETHNFYKKERFNKKYQSLINHLLKNEWTEDINPESAL